MIPWPAVLCQDSATNGATVQNNSWAGEPSPTAYSALEEEFDLAVRDADASTAALEALTVVFAASNEGGLEETIDLPPELAVPGAGLDEMGLLDVAVAADLLGDRGQLDGQRFHRMTR